VGVYKLVAWTPSSAPMQDQPSPRGLTLAQMDSLRDEFARGDRIAVWQTGVGGLPWIEDLVRSGAALEVSEGGYPSVFYAKAVDVVPRLDSPPGAKPIWISGPDDGLTEEWAGTTVVDHGVAATCTPDEWLLFEAWDES
jgi:hypothetical protein